MNSAGLRSAEPTGCSRPGKFGRGFTGCLIVATPISMSDDADSESHTENGDSDRREVTPPGAPHGERGYRSQLLSPRSIKGVRSLSLPALLRSAATSKPFHARELSSTVRSRSTALLFYGPSPSRRPSCPAMGLTARRLWPLWTLLESNQSSPACRAGVVPLDQASESSTGGVLLRQREGPYSRR